MWLVAIVLDNAALDNYIDNNTNPWMMDTLSFQQIVIYFYFHEILFPFFLKPV